MFREQVLKIGANMPFIPYFFLHLPIHRERVNVKNMTHRPQHRPYEVILLGAIWMLLAGHLLHAQSAPFFSQYSYQYITERSGLPHSHIRHIIQDGEGYIWAATPRGMIRYDGYQIYTFDTHTSPIRLKSESINRLCEDNFHRLWVASEGGLDVIRLANYTNLSVAADNTLQVYHKRPLYTNNKDQQGSIWISTGQELWCLTWDEQGHLADWHRLRTEPMHPIGGMADWTGTFCAAIGNQLYKVEKHPDHTLHATLFSPWLKPFSNDWHISCLQPDDDVLWMGSNRGLFRFNPHTRELRRYRYSTHRTGMLSQAYITDIKLTGNGHLIASTLNGLNVYHRDSDSFEFIRPTDNRDDEASINCAAIHCLFTSGETIWAGTDTGGINLLAPKRLQAQLCDATPYLPSGTGINALSEDREGNLWLGCEERGLVRWNPHHGITMSWTFVPPDESSLRTNTLVGLLIDSHQRLWAYTWGVGVNRIDLRHPQSGKVRRYTREQLPDLPNDFISSACEDTLNRGIWFGSARGLWFCSESDGPLPSTLPLFGISEHEAIHAMLIDSDNHLWIGTTQGLFVADLRTFTYEGHSIRLQYRQPRLGSDADQPDRINSILQDHKGHIWLGGNGSGLYRLEHTGLGDYTFSNFSVRQGLPAGTIIGMTQDSEEYLWIVTTEGLTKLEPSTMTFTNYTKADGFPASQYYWNGIHYSSRYDRLFLACSDGLLIIQPKETHYSWQPMTSSIHCTSLTVAGSPVYPSGERGDYISTSDKQRHKPIIRLHESESRFSIGLSSCNYGNSNRIRFAYRLKGYEKEWNETEPGNNTIRYTAVPPGSYTLQAMTTDASGRWSDQYAELEVNVIPYFYKTKSFLLRMWVLLVSAAWLFYGWKVKNYREQKEKLEKKVEERTHKLAQQNQQLEEMAHHIEAATEEKIAFFTNITHEFRTPVTLIHGPIEHALRHVDDPHLREQLEIAKRNSGYLLSLVNELMDFRKLDLDKVTLDRKPCHIGDFLTGLLMPFRLLAEERRITLRCLLHIPHPYLLIDSAYMRKAMVNLISNAIKFTPDQGRIDLYAAQVLDKSGTPLLYLAVSDTGPGIVEADKEKIFDRFFQSKQSLPYPSHGQSGTGIGLFLCRKIVSLHGGTIHARNNPRQGASFRILMPFVEAPLPIAPEIAVHTEEDADERPATASTTTDRRRDCILVVEDNTDMRRYIASLLDKEYKVLVAGHGMEALDLIRRKHIDLIISDLMMPIMDGMELSRRVKSELSTSHIPFLMLTALQSQVQERISLEIGVDEYLCKPFDEEVLLLRIRNILHLRSKYRQMFSTTGDLSQLPIQKESRDQQFVKKASDLMKEHYADSHYGLDAFVADMGYSKTMVNNKLQALTGQPIGQFMKSYRLHVALRMLTEGDSQTNISEVAYAVGFNDPKYFSRCFKELFGFLPSDRQKKE